MLVSPYPLMLTGQHAQSFAVFFGVGFGLFCGFQAGLVLRDLRCHGVVEASEIADVGGLPAREGFTGQGLDNAGDEVRAGSFHRLTILYWLTMAAHSR